MFNRFDKGDSDSDEEDYRKGYMKARKDKIQMPDLDNMDIQKFNQQFVKNLLEERGLEISEKELGLKASQVGGKVKKPSNFIAGGYVSFEELKKELQKAQGNIPQLSTVLKDIVALENLPKDSLVYYSVLRCEILNKNKQFEDCKSLCSKLQTMQMNVLDQMRVNIQFALAQSETSELWNAWMWALRAQSVLFEVKQLDETQCTVFNVYNLILQKKEPIVSVFDVKVEDVVKQLDDLLLHLRVKASKDRKTVSLLAVQGSSNTGCLGMGEEVTDCQELQYLPIFRGKQILSLTCGEHHVLALVSGCSCFNQFEPNFDCKGVSECNQGCEVLGWGENFLGQAVGNIQSGNFINTPMIIKELSGQGIVGVTAKKGCSIAWNSSGQVFQWGFNQQSKDGKGNVQLNKDITIKNIVSICIGIGFQAILDMNHNVHILGSLQTSKSSQPLVLCKKTTKLDLKNIIQIAVGDYHLLALDENGEVYGLGSNEFGQLGMRASECMFLKTPQRLNKIQQAGFISLSGNLSLVITLESELLYMGELTELSKYIIIHFEKESIDYPKTAQLTDDSTLISAQSYGGVIFALNTEGNVYRWDPDNEPKFKLFKRGQMRDMQLGRGLRVFQNNVIKGGFCSMNMKLDDDGDLEELFTYEDIKIELNLKDEYGDYGVKFGHPVRLHYFITQKESKSKKEIIEISQMSTLKQMKQKQDAQIYPYKLLEDEQGQLITFDINQDLVNQSVYVITLQVKMIGSYSFYVLLNEEIVNGSPLKFDVQKGAREEEEQSKLNLEALQKKQKDDELQLRKAEKQRLENERLRLLQEEQDQLEQRQRETKQRADEALKIHLLKQQEEQKKLEEDRKQKKDLLVGGGFNLDKHRQQQSKNLQEEQIKPTPQPISSQQATPQQNIPKQVVVMPQQRTSSQQPKKALLRPQVQQPQQPVRVQPQQQVQQQPQVSNLQQSQQSFYSQARPKVENQTTEVRQGQKKFTIRQTNIDRQSQSQAPQVKQLIKSGESSRRGHNLPQIQLQKSAVQQSNQQQPVFRRTTTSGQGQRWQDNDYQLNTQMAKTETKMIASPQTKNVQNFMDPFQMQMDQLRLNAAQQMKKPSNFPKNSRK